MEGLFSCRKEDVVALLNNFQKSTRFLQRLLAETKVSEGEIGFLYSALIVFLLIHSEK